MPLKIIPQNLSLKDFNEINNNLYLNQPKEQIRRGNKFFNNLKGKILSYISYGCSREKVTQILRNRIKKQVKTIGRKVNIYSDGVKKFSKLNKKFLCGLVLLELGESLKELKKILEVLKNNSVNQSLIHIQKKIHEGEQCLEKIIQEAGTPEEMDELEKIFEKHLSAHPELETINHTIQSEKMKLKIVKINLNPLVSQESTPLVAPEIIVEQAVSLEEGIPEEKKAASEEEKIETSSALPSESSVAAEIPLVVPKKVNEFFSGMISVLPREIGSQEAEVPLNEKMDPIYEKIHHVVSYAIVPKASGLIQEVEVQKSGDPLSSQQAKCLKSDKKEELPLKEEVFPLDSIASVDLTADLVKEQAQETSISDEIIQKFQQAVEDNLLSEELVKQAASLVDAPLKNGNLPLHYAIHYGNRQTIDLLIDYANLEKTDKHGFNAFDHAVQMCNRSVAEAIMKKNIKNEWTSLKQICANVKAAQTENLKLLHSYGYRAPPKANENDPLLVEKIKQGDEKIIEELILHGPYLFTQDSRTKKTLFHIAVEEKREDAVLFFLLNARKLKNSESYLDLKDAQGNTAEKLAKDFPTIQRLFSECKSNQYSLETWEMIKKQSSQVEEITLKYSQIQNKQELALNGYRGHNLVLVKAIENSDTKAFISAYLDGANAFTRDSDNGETLLHKAVRAGQEEIVFFLLALSLDAEVKNSEGFTALDLAQKEKRTNLIQIFSSKYEKQESFSNELKNKLQSLDANIDKHFKDHKARQTKYSAQEKKQNPYEAKYGVVGPQAEGEKGHHPLLLKCLKSGDLNSFIKWVELGADLDTISFDKSLEKGKSLLDMAVLYAKEGGGHLEIIAYLLSKGLEPEKVNDEGETPLSIALIKGDLKAAFLMKNYKTLSDPKKHAPEIEEKSLDKVLLLLMEGSRLRDPLSVNSTKLTAAVMAGASLLGSLYLAPGGSIAIFMQFLPLLINGFLLAKAPTFREKLTKNQEVASLSGFVQQARSLVGRAAVLEIAAIPQVPVFGLTSTAFDIYSSALSVFSTMQTIGKYGASRPFQAIYKMSVEALPAIQNVLRFKSLFSTMFFNPIKEEGVCKAIDPEKFNENDPFARIGKLEADPNYNPNCIEHQKIVLNWNEKELLKSGKTPASYERKLFQKQAKLLHPDKQNKSNISSAKKANDYMTQLNLAHQNMQKSFSTQTVTGNSYVASALQVMWPVVVKTGIVWGMAQKAFMDYVPGAKVINHPHVWTVLTWGSIAYKIFTR